MNEDIAFFEFRGKITNRGHAEDQGEPLKVSADAMSILNKRPVTRFFLLSIPDRIEK